MSRLRWALSTPLPEGHILRCNAEFAEIIGYPREEVRGLMIQEINPGRRRCTVPFVVPETVDRGQRCPEPFEIRLIRKDGSLTWAKLCLRYRFYVIARAGLRTCWRMSKPFMISRSCGVHASRTRRGGSAAQRQTASESLFYTSPDGVLIARGEDGKIVEVNPALLGDPAIQSRRGDRSIPRWN